MSVEIKVWHSTPQAKPNTVIERLHALFTAKLAVTRLKFRQLSLRLTDLQLQWWPLSMRGQVKRLHALSRWTVSHV